MRMPQATRVSGARAIVALASAFIFAVIVVAGATQWVPQGAAKIDQIAIPVILFPVVWIVFGLMLFAAQRRLRIWAIVGSITAVHLFLAATSFLK